MQDNKLHTPELRFPEFHDDWQVNKLGELTECVNQRNKGKMDLPIYSISNKDGFILQSEQFDGLDSKQRGFDTSLYKIVKSKTFAYNPARINVGSIGYSGDIQECLVSSLYVCFKTTEELEDAFMSYIFDTSFFKKAVNNNVEGGIRSYLFYENFSRITIPFPTLPEQRKIALCLSSLDSLIESVGKKIDLLKQHKKGLMQKLFPKKDNNIPELRFPEFANSPQWETKTLGNLTKLVNRRNKSKRDLPIYSISNKDGFVLQTEQFNGLDSTERGYDTSLYKIVASNTFAYNPARINVGSIGYSGNIKEGLVSSLYVCFKTTDELDDSFLSCFFDTTMFKWAVDNNVEGGIRSYLFYENFSRIKIKIPSLKEQKRIAFCIASLDEEIKIFEDKHQKLQKHKNGLMQKMFVNNL